MRRGRARSVFGRWHARCMLTAGEEMVAMSNYEKRDENSSEKSKHHTRSSQSSEQSQSRQAGSDKTGESQANDQPGSAPESGDKEP